MVNILGNKSTFAIEIEMISVKPYLLAKTCLWIANEKIGHFEQINMLGPFLNAIQNIVIKHEHFWEPELLGLNCKELFLKVWPFWGKSDDIYNLSDEEIQPYIKFDKFSLALGENYDDWDICVVIHNNECKFLWVKFEDDNLDKVKCFEVNFETIRSIHTQLKKIIPEEYH